MGPTISRLTAGAKALAVLAVFSFSSTPSLSGQSSSKSGKRQVFIEAALVQVTTGSTLDRWIELLAGIHERGATWASSLRLEPVDFEDFNGHVKAPDPGEPTAERAAEAAAAVPGGLLAIMHSGKLPAIIRLFKTDRDSQVLATPFVLADNNVENKIDITETRHVSGGGTGQIDLKANPAEEAGIMLKLIPTISESEKAVFLQMDLEISEFAETSSGIASTLPPKISNVLCCSVMMPEKQVVVIGGLTRQVKRKFVSKIPILGYIPLLGRLFRSEETVQIQNNLYIFIEARILTE